MIAAVAESPTLRRSAAGGARRDGPQPTRRCIASGELRAKRDLLRFVVAPDGGIVPDLAAKLPGRGLWLLPRRDMIDKACARNLFARAAKAPVRVPQDLADQVARGLSARCLDLLGLARRAGMVTAGYEKVKARLAKGRAAALIQATDGAPGQRRKLTALAHAVVPDLPVVACFTAEQLGRPLGRAAAVHVLVAPGPMAERFLAEAARLSAVARDGDSRNGS